MSPKSAKILLLPLLLVVAFMACKKSDSAKPAKLSYTAKMGGVRNWHGSHYYDASGMHFPTPIHESYYYPDTSFAITIVDDSTVQFGSRIFKYDEADTARQIYFFGGAYYYFEYGMEEGIAYYYAKDSIVYCKGDRHGTSDEWTLRNLYYTY